VTSRARSTTTVRAIEDAGGAAIAVRCDIGDEDDIHHLVDATVAQFGRLDVLLNNAMSPTQALLADSTVGEWDESMRVNVRSLYVFTKAVTPHMVAVGGGSIVNMSSHGAAHETTPFMPPGYLVYSVAKAALERFSSAAAPELAPLGIAINALRPGAVKTEMTTLEYGEDHDWSGWNTPESVVPAAAALAVKRAGEFTGRIVDVAGYGKSWE